MPGTIDRTLTKTFAKKPKLAKLLREPKSTPVRHNKKKSTGFYHMSVTAICCVFGCFATKQHVDGCCLFMHFNIYNWLINGRTLKICHWIVMSIFNFGKRRHCFRFSSFLIDLLFCMCCNWSVNLACRTTTAEDAYQSLTIPFRANNSLKYLPLPITNIQKKFCRVSVPAYPWVLATNYRLCRNGYSATKKNKKYSYELSTHILNETAVSVQYVYSRRIVLIQWKATLIKWNNENGRQTKTTTSFPTRHVAVYSITPWCLLLYSEQITPYLIIKFSKLVDKLWLSSW